MTTRELTSPLTGSIVLDARSIAARIRVSIADTDHARGTVSTPDTEGASHDAVTAARLEHAPGCLTVRLEDRGAAVAGITVVGSGNRVSVSAISVGRNVSIIGGRVIIDGVEHAPGACGTAGAAPITIDAVLPHGSRVQLGTESGDITLTGRYPEARAQSVSGDITADNVLSATMQTTSGDIRITAAGRALTNTVSGDTVVDTAAEVAANSVSGDIRVHEATGMVSAATVSGDITVRHTGPAPLTRTVTGRVRVTAAR